MLEPCIPPRISIRGILLSFYVKTSREETAPDQDALNANKTAQQLLHKEGI